MKTRPNQTEFERAPDKANSNTPQDHFGLCPKCKSMTTILNIERSHFAVCHKHKVAWHVGWNLLDAWRHENDDTWRKNVKILETYQPVTPYFYPRGGISFLIWRFAYAMEGVRQGHADAGHLWRQAGCCIALSFFRMIGGRI